MPKDKSTATTIDVYKRQERDFALVWTDEDLISQIHDVMITQNEEERQKQYDEIFTFISENALTVPIYYPITSFAVNPARVADFEIGVNNYATVEWHKLDVAE